MKYTEFKFSIGGFSQGWTVVELVDGSIIISRNNNAEVDSCTPVQGDWDTFSDSLNNLNIWKWKKDYRNSSICDGTQWELLIKEGSSKIDSSGSNAFPSEFDDFVSSVNQLVKSDVFNEL